MANLSVTRGGHLNMKGHSQCKSGERILNDFEISSKSFRNDLRLLKSRLRGYLGETERVPFDVHSTLWNKKFDQKIMKMSELSSAASDRTVCY